MNNQHFLGITFILLSLVFTACKRDNSMVKTNEQSNIQKAEQFFNQEILGKIVADEVELQSDSNSFERNPRKQLIRRPDWKNASIVKLIQGEAILVPILYDHPFIVKSNVSGSNLYNINSLSKLLIFRDKDQLYQVQMVTALPDGEYSNLPKEEFTGLVLVEDWWGHLINRYKYEANQNVKTYVGHKKESAVLRASRNKPQLDAPLVASRMITVCYEMSGYNYSGDDPDDGYYWVEPLGCDTYYDSQEDNNWDYGYPGPKDYDGLYTRDGDGPSNGGTSPIPPPNRIILLPGRDIIANINDYNKCFSNLPGSDHSYEVKLCVAQPIPGSREPWAFTGVNGSSATGNPFFVGHTFLILTEKTSVNTISRNVGFYPQNSVTPYSPTDQGQLNNDDDHDFNISLTITLTNSQFADILTYIAQGNNLGYTYNLNSNNCTTFALNALSSIGINLPRTTGNWLNGSGQNPGDLGQDIRSMHHLAWNMTRSNVFSSHPNQGTCY